jgi:DNA helicase HerA-like ATPase
MSGVGDKKPKARPYADMKNPFSVDERGAYAEYLLRDPESMPFLGIGARVLIHDVRSSKELWISGTVVGLRAITPFEIERENLLYIEKEGSDPFGLLHEAFGPHNHEIMIVRVRLEQEMTPSKGTRAALERFECLGVQRPPNASSFMIFPELLHQEGSDVPALEDILKIRPDGVELGAVGFGNAPYVEQDQFLIYKWDIENLDNKHIFIVGESGSGKTVLLKNLALSIRKKIPATRVIMADVQGDLVQMILPGLVEVPDVDDWQTKIERPSKDDAIKALEPFQLVIPALNPRVSPDSRIEALKKLAKNRNVTVKEIGLRLQDLNMPSDVEYLYRVASEQAAMLLDEEAEFIRTQNEPVTIQRLRNNLKRLQEGGGNQFTSDGGTVYYMSTAFAAMRALRSLEDYFDFHQPSMTSPVKPLDVLDFDGTTIVYLEHLNYEERLMWEMQLVKWLYDNKASDWKAFVFFDEAHQIVPARPPEFGSKGTFARLRSNFEKLAREGRKFDINLVLSTQSPRDLHEIVPEQCQTRIVMKIDPKNAMAAFLEPELAHLSSSFGHGQFWLKSPFNGSPNWVRIHSWAPNLPHCSMTKFWGIVDQAAKKEK